MEPWLAVIFSPDSPALANDAIKFPELQEFDCLSSRPIRDYARTVPNRYSDFALLPTCFNHCFHDYLRVIIQPEGCIMVYIGGRTASEVGNNLLGFDLPSRRCSLGRKKLGVQTRTRVPINTPFFLCYPPMTDEVTAASKGRCNCSSSKLGTRFV